MLENAIDEHLNVVRKTFSQKKLQDIYEVGKSIGNAFQIGGKVIIFGNGGSAADAQHISAEFISKLKKDRQALPSLALTVDTSALTAIGNDYGFREVFSRQLFGLCSPNDIVIGISTSGLSTNVIKGLEAAKTLGAKTVALTGKKGITGVEVDYVLDVISENTARITYIIIGHLLCGVAEKTMRFFALILCGGRVLDLHLLVIIPKLWLNFVESHFGMAGFFWSVMALSKSH